MQRSLVNTGCTFFGQMKPKYISLDQMGSSMFWSRLGQDYHTDCIALIVEHGGRSVLIQGCMSAKGVGEMTFTDGIMNTSLYTQILNEKMTPGLKVGRRGISQNDNNPKHTINIT